MSGGFLNLGRDIIADALIAGGAYQPFNNANAHLAVGDSGAAFNRAHADLQGANKTRLPVLPGYPQRANNLLSFHAEADGNTANYSWQEWGVTNHPSAGQLLVRFVQDLGTKGAGAIWQAQATVTVILP